jgi:hypothetical protein
MPRSLTLLVVAAFAPISLLSFGCAERTKSEEAPTPAATAEPPASVAVASSIAPINRPGMRRLVDVNRPRLQLPTTMSAAPAAAPATDASTP